MPSYVCSASVGYLDTDGTLYSIKVSMDGFKSCVGACLLMYYNTYDKVCELVHYGNMHEIGRCISEDQFDFEREKERLKNLDYICRYPIANYCIPLYKKYGYRHLDERPDMTPKMYFTGCLGGYSENLLDAISESHMFRSMNNYLFIDGEWWYRYDSYGEFRKLTAEGCEIESMRNETIDKKYPYEDKMIAIARLEPDDADKLFCQPSYHVKQSYNTVTFEFYGDLFTLAKDLLSEWKNDSIADMYAKMVQDEKIYYDAEMETAWMLSNMDEFFEKYNHCNFIFLFSDGEWWVKERGKRATKLRFMTQDSFDSYSDYQNYMFMKECGFNPKPSSEDTLDKVISDETTHSATISIVTNVVFGKSYGDIIRLESKEDVFGTTEFKNLLSNGIRHIDLTWHIHPVQLIKKAIIDEYGDSVKFVSEEEDSFAVSDTDQIIELADSDYNYLYDEVDWFIRYRGQDEYVLIFSEPVDSDKSVDYVEEETTMNGIKTCPVFDQEYFHVGDVVKITCSSDLQYKNTGWKNCPASPFNAIILDVMHEKILICYYCKQANKQVGRFAIPVRLVADGTIKIDIISRYKE